MGTSDIQEPGNYKAGYVAIVGNPNAGKSTLMNAMLGQKISIVTNKPQTTRHKILGILSKENCQAIFLDTPGLLKPNYLLQKAMMNFAYSAMEEADVILLMLDVNDVNFDDKDAYSETFVMLKKLGKPVMLVVNKTDLVAKEKTAMAIAYFSEKFDFAEVHPVSALKQTGVQELMKSVNAYLPYHPPFYPPDVVSEHPERFFVSEIIREKIFEKFREEIPYSTTVDIVDFREQAGRKDVINAEIYVERDSQKGILIGRQGKALKEIGETARKDIEKFLDRPVFLELHVRVGDKWRTSETWLKKLGYKS